MKPAASSFRRRQRTRAQARRMGFLQPDYVVSAATSLLIWAYLIRKCFLPLPRRPTPRKSSRACAKTFPGLQASAEAQQRSVSKNPSLVPPIMLRAVIAAFARWVPRGSDAPDRGRNILIRTLSMMQRRNGEPRRLET